MTQNTHDIKEEWRSIQIIHIALIVGPSAFMFLSIFLNNGHYHFTVPPGSLEIFLLNLIFLVGAPLTGRYIFNTTRMKMQDENKDDRQKLSAYRQGKIIQWALLEGAGLFGIISFFIFANVGYLLLSVFHLALLILAGPRKRELG